MMEQRRPRRIWWTPCLSHVNLELSLLKEVDGVALVSKGTQTMLHQHQHVFHCCHERAVLALAHASSRSTNASREKGSPMIVCSERKETSQSKHNFRFVFL
jgi:hypothetical protein